jgi:hypothetical protein
VLLNKPKFSLFPTVLIDKVKSCSQNILAGTAIHFVTLVN